MSRQSGISAWAATILGAVLLVASSIDSSLGQEKKKGKKGENADRSHVFTGPAPAHPFDVILARPTDTSITVSIVAYEKADVYLTFSGESGKHADSTERQALKPRVPHEFVLRNLKPNTRYYYRAHVKGSGKSEYIAAEERSFHTARSPGSSFVFTMQADSHLDQGTRVQAYERSLANALLAKTDFHIDLGDTFMTDKYPKYQDAAPQYFAQRYYLGQLAHSAPLFMVLGNHDGERLDAYDGTEDCMTVWSCRLRKSLFPNPRPSAFYSGNAVEKKPLGLIENYYAWHWGDALFIALDPFWFAQRRGGKKSGDANWNRTIGKEQYDWLTKTLEGSKAMYKFVFIHHLVGGLDHSGRGGSEAAVLYEWGGKSGSGKDEFAAQRPGWPMPIHDLLKKHKVSVVFHGHDHFFARQELDDIVYQLVPQPGHPGAERVKNADEYGYLRGQILPPSGILRVTVTPNIATVDYVRTYLPSAETVTRKNGDIAFSYPIRPKR